jgi:alpha-tubulin suppressor-like RCC1 family protein
MISAGLMHTCALTVQGAAYCWGLNADGQLGNGGNANSPTPVPVAGGLTFEAISAGWWHTCALTATGAAYCWGLNFHGQLGDGSNATTLAVPAPVAGSLTFDDLAAGGHHTCAITPSRMTYCWGSNSSGQLADGGFTGGTHRSPHQIVAEGSVRFGR